MCIVSRHGDKVSTLGNVSNHLFKYDSVFHENHSLRKSWPEHEYPTILSCVDQKQQTDGRNLLPFTVVSCLLIVTEGEFLEGYLIEIHNHNRLPVINYYVRFHKRNLRRSNDNLFLLHDEHKTGSTLSVRNLLLILFYVFSDFWSDSDLLHSLTYEWKQHLTSLILLSYDILTISLMNV